MMDRVGTPLNLEMWTPKNTCQKCCPLFHHDRLNMDKKFRVSQVLPLVVSLT
jgi:hypothetical protein